VLFAGSKTLQVVSLLRFKIWLIAIYEFFDFS